jgi:hypothetical protein
MMTTDVAAKSFSLHVTSANPLSGADAAMMESNAAIVLFTPLTLAPLIGRPVEDSDDLRELVIDFGASGYLAFYDLSQRVMLSLFWRSSISAKMITSRSEKG